MSLTPAHTPWQTLIAICKTCEAKPKRLRRDLKAALHGAQRKDVRVVMTSCQGMCPKHAVTVSIAGANGLRTFISSGDADEVLHASKPAVDVDPPEEGESIVQRAF
jgi:hypothetical protein